MKTAVLDYRLVLFFFALCGCRALPPPPTPPQSMIRGGWTAEIMDASLNQVYSAGVFSLANAKIKHSVEASFPNSNIECFVVPRGNGFEVVTLSPRVLRKEEEARIGLLVENALDEAKRGLP